MEIQAIKSWIDSHNGMVVVADDVLGIVQEVRKLDPRIHVYWDELSDEFYLVETCLDQTERLIFAVPQLDARVLDRLRRADHWGGNPTPERYIIPDDEDFAARMDADNEALEEALESRFRDRRGEAGERLAWALDVGAGPAVKGSISVPKDVGNGGRSQRAEPSSG